MINPFFFLSTFPVRKVGSEKMTEELEEYEKHWIKITCLKCDFFKNDKCTYPVFQECKFTIGIR